MSAVRPEMSVPWPEIAEVRWRSQAEGSLNHEDKALGLLVVSVAAQLSRETMGLLVRLLRIKQPVVSA